MVCGQTPCLLPYAVGGWCAQCRVLGLTQTLPQCQSGHQQGRKANAPSLGCVCAASSVDGAIWEASVECPVPWVVLAGQDTLAYLSWVLHPARGFPTLDQTPVRSWDKDFSGHSCATATRTGCNLLAAACFVTNIMLCSPSSPCILLTEKSLQAITLGLFFPADSEGNGQCDRCAGGREKECGVPRPCIPPQEDLTSYVAHMGL